jgi:hypothetical protein
MSTARGARFWLEISLTVGFVLYLFEPVISSTAVTASHFFAR